MTPHLRHHVESLCAHGFYYLCQALPVDMASDLGALIGRTIGPMLGMSKYAADNLRHFLPALSPAQRGEVLLGMWENLGRVMAEYPHLKTIAAPESNRLEIIGGDETKALLARYPSAIFFSGHLGNWELFQQVAHLLDVPTTMIYRRPNNPHVERLLMQARGGNNDTHIAKGHTGARKAMAVLKNKGVIGMLVDQKLNEGIPVPFFGRPAMTAPAIAHFARRFECPIIPARVERLEKARFRVTLYPALFTDQECHPDHAVEKMLLEINQILESWIRERPDQWLWAHRRWGALLDD